MDKAELIEARTRLKLSQSQLAGKLGISERQIRRFEKGEIPIEAWLPLALDSLLRDVADMLNPALVRAIRNATTVDDLAFIKAAMGLTEPEIPFTREQLQKLVDELMDDENGLYFDDDDESLWDDQEDEDGEPTGNELTPSELAERLVDKWFAENFETRRGRPIDVRHMLRKDVEDFLHDLIYQSHSEFSGDSSDDSRDRFVERVDQWLNDRYGPYMIRPDIKENDI